MAEVAKERLEQMQNPELSIEQAMLDYKRLGYSNNWINQRLKSIEVRRDLTDECVPVYISLIWNLSLKFDASALNKQAGNLEGREVFYSFNVRKRLYGGAA